MTRVEVLVAFFDDAWFGASESVQFALSELTPEEATWQHPAYASEQLWPNMPLPGSVLWHIAHLEHSARHYLHLLRYRPLVEEPSTPPPNTLTLATLLEQLQHSHIDLRAVIAALDEEQLMEPCARGIKVGEFIAMVIRHDTWHAAQIMVARRLYRCAQPN